jgi:hypothetical protein
VSLSLLVVTCHSSNCRCVRVSLVLPVIYIGGMWTRGSSLREEGAASGKREAVRSKETVLKTERYKYFIRHEVTVPMEITINNHRHLQKHQHVQPQNRLLYHSVNQMWRKQETHNSSLLETRISETTGQNRLQRPTETISKPTFSHIKISLKVIKYKNTQTRVLLLCHH